MLTPAELSLCRYLLVSAKAACTWVATVFHNCSIGAAERDSGPGCKRDRRHRPAVERTAAEAMSADETLTRLFGR
jgi:hypothetical protein